MLRNPRKTLGFKKKMVYKIPPGGGGKPYPASGLIELVPLNLFIPSSDMFADRSKAVLLLWNFCYLCFMFVFIMLPCLFLTALRSPAGKGLTSWLSCV